MRIRKLGEEGPFREYRSDGCVWCEAGQHVAWAESGGVIFFENDAGELRRVQCMAQLPGMQMLTCEATTHALAGAELARGEPRDAGDAGDDQAEHN